MAEAGLVQCNVWIPAACVPEFQRAAELARIDRNLTIGRMVSCVTGRLSGLRTRAEMQEADNA